MKNVRKESKLNVKRRKICPSGKLNKRNIHVTSFEDIIIKNIISNFNEASFRNKPSWSFSILCYLHRCLDPSPPWAKTKPGRRWKLQPFWPLSSPNNSLKRFGVTLWKSTPPPPSKDWKMFHQITVKFPVHTTVVSLVTIPWHEIWLTKWLG